ncbi:MAG: tRNA (N(6)-L-threonylcarbamoyladenosine(37)-C(2))-methylthiotransferase, partial [Candidatus Bathyarchaeota archaeon]
MLRKHVYFESYGCPSNKFDMEVMMASLKVSGHVVTESPKTADILVINTCGVKKTTEDKILDRLRSLRSLYKPIIVTGCLPKIDPDEVTRAVPDYLAMLDPFSIDKISTVIDGYESGKLNQHFFSREARVKVEMPRLLRSQVSEIVPISEGCLGECTFCCTRFARGSLFSYPLETIVERVREHVHDGTMEIWLTAQDTGVYGLDCNLDLASLLEEICKVRGEFYLRVGMMNPNNIQQILDRLVRTYKSKKVFKFLHAPVQSGSDSVLKLMNRFYTVSDFRRIADTFRRAIPDLSLATDIICGFPGEDE